MAQRTPQKWLATLIETFWQDVCYGFRVMLRTPGISSIAILSLALGIGANAAIFALIDRVIVSNLPVKRPQELVLFREIEAYWRYQALRQHSKVFSQLAGTASLTGVGFEGRENPENSLTGRIVSANYFETLGVQPLMGHVLARWDDDLGDHPEIVISHALWSGRFHGDPAIIGKFVRLGAGRLSSDWGTSGFEENRPVNPTERSFTIVGVMPPTFTGETVAERPDFWASITMEEHFLPGRHWLSRRTANWVRMIGRLRPGLTVKQAETATTILNRTLSTEAEGRSLTESRRQEIERSKVKLLEGEKGFSDLRLQFAKPLWVLLAMVGVVLLIACANLANLLLAKGTARAREIATRMALGVERSRLVRQLMTESFLLSLLGALLSLPAGWVASRALFAMVSEGNPALQLDLSPDGRVLLFTGSIAVLTTLSFGVVPAIRATRVDIHSVLRESGRSTQSARSRMTGEKVVVVLQVALSTVLLFGTILFTRTLYNLRAQEIGYSTENLLTVRTDPTGAGYRGDQIGDIAQRVLEKIRATPGINSATYSDNGLFGGQDSGSRIRVEGYTSSKKTSPERFDQVGPGYFATMGVPILLGRDFFDSDTARAPRAVIINQSLAKFYFGRRNPLGATIFYDGSLKFALTVVGVTKDVKADMREENRRRFYVPYMQPVDGQMGTDYEVRSALPTAVLDREIRHVIHSASPRLPIVFVKAVKTSIDSSLTGERLLARLSVVFGALALILGVAGLYGVMAYAVARRRQEIGIRIAIGGRPANIVRAVLADTMLVVGVGLLIGIPIALSLSSFLQSLLFGLKPMDPLSAAMVIGVMGVIACIAAIVPARRAMRIDPVIALRGN